MCIGNAGKAKEDASSSGKEISNIFILGGTESFHKKQTDLAEGSGVCVKCYASVTELVFDSLEDGAILVTERKFYRSVRALQDVLDENGIANPIVACSNDASIEDIVEFIRSGGMSFVTPPNTTNGFLKIKEYIDKYLFEYLLKNKKRIEACKKIAALTKREKEILLLLQDGSQNITIAGKLKISKRTVEIHRKNMLRKTQCFNAVSAIRMLEESQLLNRNY